jgi:hypothetical protein
LDILCNSKDTDRSRINSIHERKHCNYTAITKTSNFHSHIYFLNTKNYLLLFTIFSIVLPVGIQPQLQTTEAFDESVINDNIHGMRDDSNGNDNDKTNKNGRAFEDPASTVDLTSSDSQIGTQSTDRNNKILPNDESKEEELGFHESTQLGYKTYRDHVNSNMNENSNDNIIVTDDKLVTESSSTDSQIGTTDSQIGTPNSNVSKNANGKVNEKDIVPDDQLSIESTSSATATSQSQLSVQSSHEVYGDFNGDGNDDLAIGVPNEDVVSGGNDEGAVNVIYGSLSGLSATTVPDQFWTQNSGNVADSSETGDNFGESLAAGDFNADGRDDLAIGVPNEDVGVAGPIIDSAGAVNVIYGSASGLSATTVPDQFWTQNTPNVADSSESLDFFGARLT